MLACIFYVELLIGLIDKKGKEEAYSAAIDAAKNECAEEYGEEFIHFDRILNNKI